MYIHFICGHSRWVVQATQSYSHTHTHRHRHTQTCNSSCNYNNNIINYHNVYNCLAITMNSYVGVDMLT